MKVNNPSSHSFDIFRRGKFIEANYQDTEVDYYYGNPFIEALPPIWEGDQVTPMFMRPIPFKEEHRAKRPAVRLHYIQHIIRFFQPLGIHIDLEQRVSRMIRAGLVDRNPMHRRFAKDIRDRIELMRSNLDNQSEKNDDQGQPNGNDYQVDLSIQQENKDQQEIDDDIIETKAYGFSIIGASGVGKTVGVERVLGFYPQVIFHNQYGARKFTCAQIVWLHLNCPHDGSPRGLCFSAFHSVDRLLGTYYYQHYARNGRATKDEMIEHLANVVSWHGLGCLVIDELQRLAEINNTDSKELLQFFVQLVNVINVPLVLIGTYKARGLLASEFRQARRGTGQGDLIWDPMKFDETWEVFLQSFWNYQYLAHPVELTEGLSKALYEESCGITDFAVKLFLFAQYRAITTGKEKLTQKLIGDVAKDSFRLARPALRALTAASNTKNEARQEKLLEKYEDLLVPDWNKQLNNSSQNGYQSNEYIIRMLLNELEKAKSKGAEKTPATKADTTSTPNGQPASKGKTNPKKAEKLEETPSANGKTLNDIVAQGVKRGSAAYQSLQEAGFIKSANEFLEVSGS